jgi:hypothetical protein
LKRFRWRSILAGLAGLLVLAGVTPLVCLLSWGYLHKPEALSVPVLLKHGEYVSPFFTTDLSDDYQIDIWNLPPRRMPLDIDWKVVDETGALIQSGTYTEDGLVGGNEAILDRHYRPKRRTHQRVILHIRRGLQQTSEPDLRLHVGVPERGLQQAYGSAAAVAWLAMLAGPGASILVVLAILRVLRRPDPRVAAR